MASSPNDLSSGLETLVGELSNATKSYDPSAGLEGFKSRVAVIAKAKQITAMMTDPSDLAFMHSANMIELVAIRTLMSLHVLEKIPQDGSISLQELSEATGAQDSLIERLLRVVVGTGFLDQTSDLKYIHTKFSKAYREFPGPGAFFQLMYDNCFLNMDRLPEYLAERGLSEPESQTHNPYTWTNKQDGKTIWEIMAQNPERLKVFQMGLGNFESSVPIVGFYDFSQLNTSDTRPILVDVGGGGGQSIIQILKTHPDLPAEKFILQDLPGPIAYAKASERLPQAVVKMEIDFWTEQPVKGAKAYYVRRVLHDYSDENCIRILKHLAGAMSADSRVLLADMVMPARVTEADLAAAVTDVCVMVMGGKERTEEGFKTILKGAGLELVKVWRASVGAGALVEARLASGGV